MKEYGLEGYVLFRGTIGDMGLGTRALVAFSLTSHMGWECSKGNLCPQLMWTNLRQGNSNHRSSAIGSCLLAGNFKRFIKPHLAHLISPRRCTWHIHVCSSGNPIILVLSPSLDSCKPLLCIRILFQHTLTNWLESCGGCCTVQGLCNVLSHISDFF